mmetsp:Transcript_65396/g.206650  ORF Transcript_65396/g.206650 Transcript_65396/m.206650 type:complete len:286 (-) Transcript_65396:2281-3138(-)
MVGQKAAWLLLALLATASLIGPCAAVEETALAENEEAQADGLEAPNEVVSATVTEADPVDLQSGTGDVSTTDDCADDIKEFCSTTEVGENRLRDCLTKQQEAESKGNVDGKTLSEPCKVELKEFKVVESTNINLDVGMAGACKEDADKFCKDAANWDEPGPVIACLREVKEEIGEACLAHIFLQEKEVLPHAPPLCGCSPSSSCPCCRGGHVRHVVWGWQRSPCNQLRPRRCASAGCQGHGRGPRASRDVRGRRENPVPWHQARGGLGPGVPAREALPHHVGVRG